MSASTPLAKLSQILCASTNAAIFKNQVIMYQLLIQFSSNKLKSEYGTATTDELIKSIHPFIRDCYYDALKGDYNQVHQCILSNIVSFPVEHTINLTHGDTRYFNVYKDSSLTSNINKAIHHSHGRKLSYAWIKEWQRNSNNIDTFLYRIFWMLQYYCVYYLEDNDIIKNNHPINLTDCIEYFSLSLSKRRALLKELQSHCSSYSATIEFCSADSLNFYSLARIFLDIIVAHVNYTKQISDSAVPFSITERAQKVTDIRSQKFEYETYLANYGKRTLDRLNVLKYYSKNNCYAAFELGIIYFYGDDLLTGGNNHYIIHPNYRKAIKCFLSAITNSNPPHSPSCWWIGHILKEKYSSSEDTAGLNLQKAKYYFTLAGDYPPAYNSLAQLEIKEADFMYESFKNGSKEYSFEKIVKKYTDAIKLADQAASMKWFYANNVIASFISNHENEPKLLKEIEKKLDLSTPFNYVTQLECSCKFNNPWALNAMACYYIKYNQYDKAKRYLDRACDLNYNRAYYTLAMNFLNDNKKEAALKKASSLLYPLASYELAIMYMEHNQLTLAKDYTLLAEQQNISLRKIDLTLQQKIQAIKILLT